MAPPTTPAAEVRVPASPASHRHDRVVRLDHPMAPRLLIGLRMRDNRGFSLIEVLVIIVLVGVLAGIAIAQYASFRSRGVDSKIAAVVRGVATSEEAFYAAHRFYTGNLADLDGMSIGDVTIALSPGNSGSLATSFRVAGSHTGTERTFTWLSDPLPGEPNLRDDGGGSASE